MLKKSYNITKKNLLTFLLKYVILYSRKDKTKKQLKLTGSLKNDGYLSQGFQKDSICKSPLLYSKTENKASLKMHCRMSGAV